ncbi:Ig-like domain-containing protein, partial [Pseudomonas sp. Leaf127]|uniref:Ig-like domain-containing protein n=1 Tax=Pseudomonas sp. Leaf127 TaxID=1736267 RepID=UPI002E81AD7C
MGGSGGSDIGGSGGPSQFVIVAGGAGGSASSTTINIGGGGGASGYELNDGRGKGADASGGIFNSSGAVLTIIGHSSITDNAGAGGGGVGAGNRFQPEYLPAAAAGVGGIGVGAIWNAGTLNINTSSHARLIGNDGAGGTAGFDRTDAAGATAVGIDTLYNQGTLNLDYARATIALADSSLQAGQTTQVTLTFSDAVTGFDSSDLVLANGTLGPVSSTDGGITWTATFTPDVDIEDTSNVITLDLAKVLFGGTEGTGNASSGNYTVDTLRPTVAITVADADLKADETTRVIFTFNEAVSDLTLADLTVQNGTLSAVSSNDGGLTWTATLTPAANVQTAANLITLNNTGVLDAAGNAGSGSTASTPYLIDTIRPTASIAISDQALKAGDTATVTITFSEAVSGLSNTDLSVANGTLSTVSSGDGGITWTADFTPDTNIEATGNLITLANSGVVNATGNAGAGTTDSVSYRVDTLVPTATILMTDRALIAGETSPVTITFSEAVSGLSNDDLMVENGTLSAVSSSDGGLTWTATFTPAVDLLEASSLISLNTAGVLDAAGNAGSGTTASTPYLIDTVRPTASLKLYDRVLKVGDTAIVLITFSEAVSDFSNADLSVANGTLSTVTSGDGGITWTAYLTPDTNIEATGNLITLANSGVVNATGNTGAGTTDSVSYRVDTLVPTATIVMRDSALIAGETSRVTLTFSEAVSGLSNDDLTVENGTLSAVSSSDGGLTWTATFTPAADLLDASNVISLNNAGVLDAAGNAGSGTTDSDRYAIDTVRPTASITMSDRALKTGDTATVSIIFSEAVSGFTNADLSVANGTLSTVTSADGGLTWTADFTPATNIEVTGNLITLANSGVLNATGNAGTGTTGSPSYSIDTRAPTATIVMADNALVVGETSRVTITFSEAVSGFT